MRAMPIFLPSTIHSRPNEPDPEGVHQAFARIGYNLEEALADIVDNSIDAHAANVLIRFFRRRDQLTRVVIADDGDGISNRRFDQCMQFGARIRHRTGDLGKYGIGLKSASFSQCRDLSVISMQSAHASGRRWTVESIRRGWLCEELDPRQSRRLLGADWSPVGIGSHGTLVVWENLDRIRTGSDGVDAVLNRIFRVAPVHLGMVFHRFLRPERVRIVMDTFDETRDTPGPATVVPALDPFAYRRSGHPGYPRTIRLTADGDALTLKCHIWPPKAKDPEYKLGGKAAQRQGFYFYRNNRLIQSGGWNGWREEDAEPHLSLARIEVDLPPSGDLAWDINVQKSSVDVGPIFKRLLDSAVHNGWSLKQFVRDADAVYRDAQPIVNDGALVPGTGLPRAVLTAAAKYLKEGRAAPRRVGIAWKELDWDDAFWIDRESRRLVLNSRYRGALSTSRDGTIVKLLIFLLLRDEFGRERVHSKRAAWLDAVNDLLLSAIEETS